MEPIYADFSGDPARLGGAVVRRGRCTPTPSYLAFDAGGWVELHFDAGGPTDTAQAAVSVTALVSKRGPLPGHAPIDLLINGVPLVEGHVIPGGDLPSDTAFAIPGERLVAGTNVLRIQSSATSITRLWLYRISVDTLENRGGAVRALRRATGQAATVFAFSAARRPAGTGTWIAGRRMLVHIDRGEYAELSQLSWRDEEGAEAAVSFHSAMAGFHGHHRSKDGVVSEFQGRLAGSWAAPEEIAPAEVHVFKTQESWGGGWHDSGELRLLFDTGGADVQRVGWRDRADNTGSIELELSAPSPGGAVEHAVDPAGARVEAGSGGPGELTGLVEQVSASGENARGGEVAASLIDGSIYSKWLTFSGTARLDFRFSRPAAVGSYELTSANDFQGRDPRDWRLSGSQDGQRWTVLDARSDEVFAARRESRVFRIRRADQAVYRHYRLETTRNAGSAQQTQLARIRFLRPPVAPALGFLGYYQRSGEGPIGYRGTALAATTPLAKLLSGNFLRRPTTAVQASVATKATPGRPMTPARRAAPTTKAVGRAMGTAMSKKVPRTPGVPAVAASVTAPASAEEPTDTTPAEALSMAEGTQAPLTTVAQWQAYLTEYGTDVVRTLDERQRVEFSLEQLASGWLGGDPVEDSRIAELEERLGAQLPATYRAFVGASDEWRSIGQFMYVMRGIDEIDWFRVADPMTCEILGDDEELGPILERALLISKQGDAQYWFLDPGDVSPDGEWAAYTWSSWGFLSERHPSFAALVAAERRSMEELRGTSGSPMHPEGADELLAEGRAQALRGDVEAALETFEQAAIKGSGAAGYLRTILGIFMKSEHGQHALRREILGRPHVKAAVGLEQLRAEALPLFLRLTYKDPVTVTRFPANITLFEDLVPMLPNELADDSPETEAGDPDEQAARVLPDPRKPLKLKRRSAEELNARREKTARRVAAFVPPVLPEPPAFQEALVAARALVQAGDPDGAWAVIEAALPDWHSDSATRVAPVILLIDPVLNTLITPARSRQIVRTPRGQVRASQ
jgi:hypothetical protein